LLLLGRNGSGEGRHAGYGGSFGSHGGLVCGWFAASKYGNTVVIVAAVVVVIAVVVVVVVVVVVIVLVAWVVA